VQECHLLFLEGKDVVEGLGEWRKRELGGNSGLTGHAGAGCRTVQLGPGHDCVVKKQF